MSKCIFWFRKDLRLKDNTALNYALIENSEIIPVYIIDPLIINSADTSQAKIKFILESIKELSEKFNQAKSKLIIRFGKSDEQIIKMCKELNIKKVYYNKIYDLESTYNENKIKPLLENFGLEIHSYKDNILFDNTELHSNDLNIYIKNWNKKFRTLNLLTNTKIEYERFIKKDSVLSLAVPSNSDYEIDINSSFLGGENQAIKILNSFNNPNLDFFDVISPYYEFGNISIRQILEINKNNKLLYKKTLSYLSKYNYYTFNSHKYDLSKDKKLDYNKFLSFCNAQTGIPIIDSCVNQINNEHIVNIEIISYIINFLIKILNIEPLWIERYLSNKLINSDNTFINMLMNNNINKIDYSKEYINNFIKSYLSVLKNLPDNYIKEPYKTPLSLQKYLNCIIGKDYPKPIYNSEIYQELNI